MYLQLYLNTLKVFGPNPASNTQCNQSFCTENIFTCICAVYAIIGSQALWISELEYKLVLYDISLYHDSSTNIHNAHNHFKHELHMANSCWLYNMVSIPYPLLTSKQTYWSTIIVNTNFLYKWHHDKYKDRKTTYKTILCWFYKRLPNASYFS